MEEKKKESARQQNRKKRKLSQDEFKAMLPNRLNKFGKWLLSNREAWDYGNGKVLLK